MINWKLEIILHTNNVMTRLHCIPFPAWGRWPGIFLLRNHIRVFNFHYGECGCTTEQTPTRHTWKSASLGEPLLHGVSHVTRCHRDKCSRNNRMHLAMQYSGSKLNDNAVAWLVVSRSIDRCRGRLTDCFRQHNRYYRGNDRSVKDIIENELKKRAR